LKAIVDPGDDNLVINYWETTTWCRGNTREQKPL